MELKQHPLSAAFPAMSADDFAALVEDIKTNGQREPIMLFEGMVLDGWHRYRACDELGIPADRFQFKGADPVAFAISHNLHRRHLTPSQRAAAVVACAEWQPPNVKAGRVEPGSTHAKTNAEMAKVAQVTPRTITDAKAAHKAGLGDAMKAGAITAKEGARVARGAPPAAPRPAAKKAPPVPEAPKPEELADAREAVAILTEENERLSDRLAVEAMDASEEEKLKAAATIAELRAELKTANAELKAVRAVRDDYMRENGQMKKTIESLQRKLRKLEQPA